MAYRNDFGAMLQIPDWVKTLVNEGEKAGTYTRGIESDKRNRGEAVNVDVYGYDEAQGLAVIQVRQCQFRPNRYSRVRKDYYLLGHTERSDVFAHPVESPARSKRAMATAEGVVAFVLCRLWGCEEDDLPHITRQGDVALVPARMPQGAQELAESVIVLEGSHEVTAAKFWRQGETYYCAQATLKHLPGEHRTVKHHSGIRRLVVAPRASTWGFSAPTAD